ncbi:uncharacterized protein LOC135383426 [Ornithodoros turicata]|uniref:uncharacterized protein LOC135383426 n=1 Tax=Ornithodoros turicata TaxID=34597 RepID=UPI003138E23A
MAADNLSLTVNGVETSLTPVLSQDGFRFHNGNTYAYKTPDGATVGVVFAGPVQTSQEQSTQLSNSHTVQAVNQQSGASDGSQAAQSDSLEGQELWTGPKTRFLIARYKEQKEMVGKKGGFRTKRALWQALADAISKEFDSSVTTIQVENKWKSLERAYKRTKTKNGSSGHSRVSCEHEEELGDVLEKEHHISPTTLLAPGLTIEKDSSSTPTDTEESQQPGGRDTGNSRTPHSAGW